MLDELEVSAFLPNSFSTVNYHLFLPANSIFNTRVLPYLLSKSQSLAVEPLRALEG
jgi:hypothetical protein